jgi:hypothetical protein
MRIKRVVIPVILALGVAGSILGSVAPAVVVQAPAAAAAHSVSSANPNMFYRE